MMRVRRVVVGPLVIVATACMAAGAAAWACTASAELTASPSWGPANSQTTVQGWRFETGDKGPVQIFWNSTDGPELAWVAGPNFSVVVTVPASAQPGDYMIVARNMYGTFAPATPFQVTAGSAGSQPTGSSTGTRTGSVSGGGGGQAGLPAPPESPQATSEPSTGNAPAPAESAPTAPAANEQSSVSVPQEAVAGAPTASGASTRAAPTARSGSAAPATSPAGIPSAGPLAQAVTDEESTGVPVVSPRSAAADLWSAFDDDGSPQLRSRPAVDQPGADNRAGLFGVLLALSGLPLLGLAGVGLVRQRRLARAS